MSTETEETELGRELEDQQATIALAEEDSTETIINKFKSEFGKGSGGRVRIQRKKPGGSIFEHCITIPIADFSQEYVAQTFGGGAYKVQAMNAKGKWGRQEEFSIDERIVGELDKPSTPGNHDALLLKLFEKLESQQKPAGPDPMVLMMLEASKQNTAVLMESSRQSMLMMTESMKAIAGAPKPAQMDVVGLIGALAPLAIEMIKRPAPGAQGSLKEQIDTLKSLQELTDKPEESEMSVLDKIMKVAAPFAGPAIQAIMAARQQGSAPQAAPPVQVDTNGAPQQIPEPTAPGKQMTVADLIRPAMPLLINAAKRNSEPGSYIDLVKDTQSEQVVAVVLQALREPNWRTIVFEDHPDVAVTYRDWFNDLREIAITDEQPLANPPQPTGPKPVAAP